jgi:hypothetical protein
MEKYSIKAAKVCAHAVILSVKGVDFFVIGNKQTGKELWGKETVFAGKAGGVPGRQNCGSRG